MSRGIGILHSVVVIGVGIQHCTGRHSLLAGHDDRSCSGNLNKLPSADLLLTIQSTLMEIMTEIKMLVHSEGKLCSFVN